MTQALSFGGKKTAIAAALSLCDNPAMKTFDDLHVSRPALAQAYLGLLHGQPGRPLALFAPRRIGKTWFLQHDLTPAAAKAGLLTVYADLWLHRGTPLDAINHALEEALDDANIPGGAIGKIAQTPVKAIAGVQFGDAPQRRTLPEQAELRFDALITRLARRTGQRILLMLDEIQALAESASGNSVIATLRAVLSNRAQEVCAVFTGSSQAALSQMMSTIGAPMYQFAQLLDFPVLDDAYLRLLAKHFQNVHPGKTLDLDALRQAFQTIGHKPALMKDIVKAMSAEGNVDVVMGLRQFTHDDRQIAGWQANFEAQPVLEQALLVALAHQLPPLARDTVTRLTRASGATVTISKIRAALERLRKAGILTRRTDGYHIEDSLFADYLQRSHLPTLARVGSDRSLP